MNGHDGHDNPDDIQVDKTELDDIRSGMEKERCKINYFQVIMMIKTTTMMGVLIMINHHHHHPASRATHESIILDCFRTRFFT